MEVILIRYGEISLKGKNRIVFESRLKDNIENSAGVRPKRIAGRFVLSTENSQETADKLRRVFGITSLSIAEEVGLDIESIKKECLKQAKARKFSTFRISVQRLKKNLKPSPELEKEIGAYIVEKTGKKVKLKEHDLNISVEIADTAYIFTEKISCSGGLPSGVEGNVALIIDGKSTRKSILAGLLAMKRGCGVIPIAYKKTDIGSLKEYGCKSDLFIVKDIKEAEKIAEKYRCRAFVVGQELENIADMDADLPVLRPLVGMSPETAEEILGIK